jgi:hypothetical protein
MAYEKEAVQCVAKWFERDKKHLVDVVAGPKREHWFNAEAYVALSHRARLGTFVMWGEQEWRTVMGKSAEAPVEKLKKKADLIAFRKSKGPEAVEFVIESKLICNSVSKSKTKDGLTDLRRQLLGARSCFPNAGMIGLLYIVWQRRQKSNPSDFFDRVASQTDEIFSSVGYEWLRSPSPLRGLGWRISARGLTCRHTSYYFYPLVYTCVGLAALALKEE